MKKLIKNNVYWVGKVDWELKRFHGEEFSTHHGSSYNSYLILEEKKVLIDTVWLPFAEEFVENLEKEINLQEIDFIVVNHGEVDHSGALIKLMAKIPKTPIYCSANAIKSLNGQYHQNWDLRVVKTGDKIDIGNGKELVFMDMTMIHWPDSMATFLTVDNILFSNDAFGQHYATEKLFNDLVDQCDLFNETLKYYANILTPYSALIRKKLGDVEKLPIEIIATSHGVIWRDNPKQVIDLYKKWSDNYYENQITIIYDTMWDGTKKLALEMAEGIRSVDNDVMVKILNVAKNDFNDLVIEVFKSKIVLIGSSTINNTILHSIAGFINMLKEMKFKGKRFAAFGCYGWSGEAVDVINELMKNAGFDLINDGFKNLWNPDLKNLKESFVYGAEIGKKNGN